MVGRQLRCRPVLVGGANGGLIVKGLTFNDNKCYFLEEIMLDGLLFWI